MKSKKNVTLKRELGLFTSTLLVVGLLVGSGVFQKIVPMARTGLGEASILLAWTAAGIISMFGAFSIGGLATLTEESGGAYEYFRISYGKFIAFISGWSDFMIIGTGASAAIAFLFAESINHIVTIPNPLQSWESISIGNIIFPFADFGLKLVAVFTTMVLTFVNFFGTKESGILNNIITSVKILGIVFLIVLGLVLPSPEVHEVQEISEGFISPSAILYISLLIGIMCDALWAYEGWIYAANVSGEIVNPRRNVPLALALGVGITMIIYVLTNYVYMNILPLKDLASVNDIEIGAVVVAKALLGDTGKRLILVLIIICTLGALNSNIISLPRKYFRMAQEGYFFSKAGRVNPRFRTPVTALIYSMIWTCILIFSGSFDMLSNLVIYVGFIFYGMLCFAVIRLKINGTIKAKITGYPVAPIVFLLFSAALTFNEIWLKPKQSLLGLMLILIGIPFYFYFKRKKNQYP